jgi:hypothetical protein
MSWRSIVVLAVVAVAGCGSEPQLSASAAKALHKDVAAARTAAQQGDQDAAVRALGSLEKRITTAEKDGELSSAAADALRRGAARARRRAAREIAAPQPTPEPTATATSTSTPTPTATPVAPAPKGKEKKQGKGEKPGKGNQDQGGDEG